MLFLQRSAWLILLSLTLTLGACGIVPKVGLEQPRVFVDDFQVVDTTLSGIKGLITLEIENPNDVSINAKGLDYSFSVGGQRLIRGQNEERMSIPALGRSTIQLPVRLSYLDLLEAIPKLATEGATDYLVEGSVKTGLFSIPFSKTGNLRLPSLLAP